MYNTSREQKILEILSRNGKSSSSDIHRYLVKAGESLTLITVKRLLARLKEEGVLEAFGKGRSVVYGITKRGELSADVDAAVYCAQEPDLRYGARGYDFDLLSATNFDPFLPREHDVLVLTTDIYKKRIQNISEAIHKKELERFIVELSWKSSRIEGNTYTLLDTERLLLQGIEAPGHSKEEARMIVNHKKAFTFIHDNKNLFKKLTRSNLEDVHRLVVDGFNVGFGLRSKPVGVTGSIYQPLDNQHQIREAVDILTITVDRMSDGYSKALIALLGISYIQPFEDGNKRTARLFANGILLAYGLAPLSYRSIDEKIYREAVLVFYELHSLVPFKKVFIQQYDFAARNYLAK